MSPSWTVSGRLLRFPSLDNCPYEVRALGFRITDIPDAWTQRFNEFKFGSGVGKEAAMRGASAVLSDAAHSLVLGGSVAVVGAISSADERLDRSGGIARLGEAVSARNGWSWCPGVLTKRRHQSRHQMGGNAIVRDAVVDGVYSALHVDAATVLVIDDFATRGSTIADIARAIRQTTPGAKILGLVLGKNESIAWCGGAVNNGHIPAEYERLWREGASDGPRSH
jgi:hypothetical protein